MLSSPFSKCRKRRRSSTEYFCSDQRNGAFDSSSGKVFCSRRCNNHRFSEACLCGPASIPSAKQKDRPRHVNTASSPPRCIPDQASSEDFSTGSSCCSSLPMCEGFTSQQQMLVDCMPLGVAESESWSCCGSSVGNVDVAAFLHEDALCDDATNEGFSFDPETVFVSDLGLADCSLAEDAPFIGGSAENGSWFLNELDSEGRDFLNEVLDQEWMAAAVANLEKLNDTLTSDSCVLHLLESDQAGKTF